MGTLTSLSVSKTAFAAPDCEALDETEFIALLLDGQAAVDRGNPDTYRGVVDEIRRRIPCLAFVPRSRMFADYLVLDAIAEFGNGGEWKPILTAALRVRPGVDRVVGIAHPMARFTPEIDATSERRPVPEGVRVFVDGEAASSLPPAGELHLVQVTDRGLWRTSMFHEESVSIAFLTDPIEAPLEWTWWGSASLVVGAGGVSQRRDPSWEVEDGQNAFTPNQDRLFVWPAVAARGGGSYGLFGVAGELDVGLAGLTHPIGSHVQVAVVFGRPGFRVGAGAGVGGSTKVQGVNAAIQADAKARYQLTSDGKPFVLGTMMHTSDRWDGGVSGGFGPSVLRASMYLGTKSVAENQERTMRFGFSGSAQRGWFILGDVAADEVTTVTWRAGLEVGVAL